MNEYESRLKEWIIKVIKCMKFWKWQWFDGGCPIRHWRYWPWSILGVFRVIRWTHNCCEPQTWTTRYRVIRYRAINYRFVHYGSIHYGSIHYGAIHYGSVCPIIGCGTRNSRSKIHRQAILNSCIIEELGILLGFVFGWLTLNIIKFATIDTRRLLWGRIFGPRWTESGLCLKKIRLWIVWPGGTSILTTPNCDWTQWTLQVRFKIARGLKRS